MIRSRKRLSLCITLLALNLAFIWGNSLMPGSVSGAFSDWVRELLAPLFGWKPGDSTGGGLLRKLAHFTEFMTLGILLRWLFGMLLTKTPQQWLYAAAAAILVASIDETIQLFVPNRGPAIKDVGIDTLGALLGITALTLIYVINKKIKNKRSKQL
ncbi:MAG: VanZ family protein [Oscillospiraceae bacterium]|nr:VanZ family protein [Oscillospiraceae bacterium]